MGVQLGRLVLLCHRQWMLVVLDLVLVLVALYPSSLFGFVCSRLCLVLDLLLCLDGLTRKSLCYLLCFIAGGCWLVIQFVLAAGSYAVVSCKARTTVFLLFGFVPVRGFAK
jgi:hypothetical protein